jgi:hypothetical protein
MAKSIACDMVELYLNDEFRSQWLPFPASFGAPAAWTARRFSGEAMVLRAAPRAAWLSWIVRDLQCGGEADMVELASGIVKPEEQGSDFPAAAFITEAADDAVSCSQLLHFNHRPLARLVGARQLLCNDAIRSALAGITQPSLRDCQIERGRRDREPFWDPLLSDEGFQPLPSNSVS